MRPSAELSFLLCASCHRTPVTGAGSEAIVHAMRGATVIGTLVLVALALGACAVRRGRAAAGWTLLYGEARRAARLGRVRRPSDTKSRLTPPPIARRRRAPAPPLWRSPPTPSHWSSSRRRPSAWRARTRASTSTPTPSAASALARRRCPRWWRRWRRRAAGLGSPPRRSPRRRR